VLQNLENPRPKPSPISAQRRSFAASLHEQCAARLSAYEALRLTRGFAPWVVRISNSGELIGWGGLSIDPAAPQWGLEVSYAFAPSAWGLGYATELVRSSLEYAFGALAAPEVHAFARPENSSSVRVLKKCGFLLLRFEESLERNHYLSKPLLRIEPLE
jgi:[ribosomal protein S5]-alanine N-acetyltransferase